MPFNIKIIHFLSRYIYIFFSFLVFFCPQNCIIRYTVISKVYIQLPSPPPIYSATFCLNINKRYDVLTSFQTLMSALKILTTVAKGTQPVQIPKDPSLALVILDLLGMDTTAQVIQVNQRKFSAVSISKTHRASCIKGYFFCDQTY